MKSRMIIIDSGVDYRNKELLRFIEGGVSILNGAVYENYNDDCGHGTAVSYIATKFDSEISIFSIKILGANMMCKVSDLILALKYTELLDIRTICLSLSTQVVAKELEETCNYLVSKGKIIVAAFNNCDNDSFPSIYKKVLGVRNTYLNIESEYWFNKYKKIQAVLDGTPVLAPYLDGRYWLFGGNSKATPILAVTIAKVLDGNLTLEQVENYLETNAIRNIWAEDEIKKEIVIEDIENRFFSLDEDNRVKIMKVLRKKVNEYLTDDLLEEEYLYRLGLSRHNVWDLIIELEQVFNINIDYKEVTLRDFVNINTICALMDRNNGEVYG
ncbi:MAG: S8 family serine peptidase [Sarcina sp.]